MLMIIYSMSLENIKEILKENFIQRINVVAFKQSDEN